MYYREYTCSFLRGPTARGTQTMDTFTTELSFEKPLGTVTAKREPGMSLTVSLINWGDENLTEQTDSQYYIDTLTVTLNQAGKAALDALESYQPLPELRLVETLRDTGMVEIYSLYRQALTATTQHDFEGQFNHAVFLLLGRFLGITRVEMMRLQAVAGG